MVREEFEVSTPLLANILNQAEALRGVAAHQFGEGREALQLAADLLRSKEKVLFSGMGASYFACLPFEYMFRERGMEVSCAETAELLYFGGHAVSKSTAVVLVSRSGESIEVTKLLRPARDAGAEIVGIANVSKSTLDVEADRSILLNSPADQLVAIQSYTATLAVLALLHAAVFGELEQAQLELEETIKRLEASIPKWVEGRRQWHAFVEGSAPVYLLGRGPTLGAVSEGVLLMHETAKGPAIGMSVAQFRHGPVEVVDSGFRGIVMGTQPSTVHLDAALANDLTQMGGQVRWLGPRVPGATFESLCTWPEGPPNRFASIVETIPLQILAYTKAEVRGIRPGDFRWAPAITSSEVGFALPA